MVVMAIVSSLFPVSSLHHGFSSITSSDLGCTKNASSWGLQAKANYAVRNRVMYGRSPLPVITTFRKPFVILGCKKKRLELVPDLDLGSLVKDGFVFREKFNIRSFDVGPDRKALVENLMNYLQETTLNYLKSTGLYHNGMGSTPEMNKRGLIWVTTKLHVAVDHYPTWGDVIQIDTWNVTSGTYSVRCNWMFRDGKTGDILIRASSIMMQINKKTRRLSKIPDEVRVELKHIFVDTPFIVKDNTRKWSKLDESSFDHVRNGIVPRWSDLDASQHVNNAKYIGWILESVPMAIREKYELASMTLEYRRECTKDDVLQCHTCVLGKNKDSIANYDHVDCQHLLQLDVRGGGCGDDGDEIFKGRTKWRPKYENH